MSSQPKTIELPIDSPAKLALFLWEAFGVVVPNLQVCPNHSTPWKAFCAAFFAQCPVVVIKASRGFGGKSFWTALLGIVEAILLSAKVNLVGGSGEQAQRIIEGMIELWAHESAPRYMVRRSNTRRTILTNGAVIKALMGSAKSVRGPHPQRLHVDEADEMDIKLLDAALGQPMSKNGIRSCTTIASTHQHADKTFTEVIRRAAESLQNPEPSKQWQFHEFCWKETILPHGWCPPEAVEDARARMSADTFATEVEGQEPNPKNRAILPEKAKAMFDRTLGFYPAGDREIVIEPPMPSGIYATGCDWAKEQDQTVIVTWRYDVKPFRLVAYQAINRRPWPEMVDLFERRCRAYEGLAAHDRTGVGNVVHDLLKPGYMIMAPQEPRVPGPALFAWGRAGMLAEPMPEFVMGVKAEGLVMVGQARQDLFSEYISAIEQDRYRAPYIDLMAREHLLCSRGDLTGTGHPPDTFVAGALGHHIQHHSVRFASAHG